MSYTRIIHQSLSLRIGVLVLSLLHSGAGKLEISSTNSPIKALLGQNVTIPCHFSGYESFHLDLSKVSVRWTLRSLEEEEQVYWFNGGRHIQSRPGSYISEGELEGADGSLHISDLQFSDGGDYICSVVVTPEKATREVTVQVSARPACTVSDSRLEMNPQTERSVICYVIGFYPEPVTVHWLKYSKVSSSKSKLDNQTCTSIPVQSADGTYNARSVLSVKVVGTDEDGDVYSCVITHRSLEGGLTCNVTLSVQLPDKTSLILYIIFGIVVALLFAAAFPIYSIYFKKVQPEVWDILGPALIHMEKTSLAYTIVNFSPKDIDIVLCLEKDKKTIETHAWSSRWKKNYQENGNQESDRPLLDGSLVLKPSITQLKMGVCSCICSISLTPDINKHNGAKLILEVKHKSLKKPLSKEKVLSVKAAPVLDPIEANQESYNVGDHLELRCRIHSFHPRYINVIWSREEEFLPLINNEALNDENGCFCVTSSVSRTVTEEDFGKIFRCKVEHPGTPETSKGVSWELQRKGD